MFTGQRAAQGRGIMCDVVLTASCAHEEGELVWAGFCRACGRKHDLRTYERTTEAVACRTRHSHGTITREWHAGKQHKASSAREAWDHLLWARCSGRLRQADARAWGGKSGRRTRRVARNKPRRRGLFSLGGCCSPIAASSVQRRPSVSSCVNMLPLDGSARDIALEPDWSRKAARGRSWLPGVALR
jgi:hypothetical protein